MTENYIKNLPLREIELGYADGFARYFYRYWIDSDGAMPDEDSPLAEHLDKFVILKTIHSPLDTPDIISVGTDSLLASLLPQAADAHLSEPRLEITSDYRSLVRQSYVEASLGNARYDVIGSNYLFPSGIEWLKIERLLLPFTASSGLRWIFCYSILREAQKTKDQPDQQNQTDDSTSPLDPDRLLMARAAI